MKTTALIVLVAVLGFSGTASAYRRRHFIGATSDYQSNGVFGLGLELAEPTGLTGKLFLTPSQAIDFGIGDLYHNYYVPGDGLHIYADVLWHPFLITEVPAFKLPFYIGVGGRVWFADYCGGPGCDAQIFGIRVPIGIDFDFNEVPLDVFVQIVPTLDFYHDYNNRDFDFDVDFSLGIRYWFS